MRSLARELVRPALDDEGRVDEGVVVHGQELIYALLCSSHGGAVGQRTEQTGGAVEYLQFQLRGPTSGALAVAADHPVAILAQVEAELHPHLARAHPEEILVRFAAVPPLARLSPQGVGDGVEQGGPPDPAP